MMKSFFSSFLYGVRDYDNFARSFCIYLTLFICVSSHVSSSSSRMSIWFVEGCFFFVKSLEGALRHEWREGKERKEEKKTSSLLETEAVGMGTLTASSRGYFLFSSKSFHSNENINT